MTVTLKMFDSMAQTGDNAIYFGQKSLGKKGYAHIGASLGGEDASTVSDVGILELAIFPDLNLFAAAKP
jgi:hypothetical protein